MNFDNLAYCEIYPGIGIARVGASTTEWFLAPEVPDQPPQPDQNTFKDKGGRLKRQGARFRIYGFDAAGKILGEITAEMAHIKWRVHLANVKSAWYKFENAMDLGKLAKSATRRNPMITGGRRDQLMINPGPRMISGKNISGVAFQFNNGFFYDKEVYLGELKTDQLGRLIVLGGHGVSGSKTGTDPTTFANNDDWYDDTSDGPVRASIEIDGRLFEAQPAWVAITPPNYAPHTWGVVTMYDTLLPLFQKKFEFPVVKVPEFWQNIYPIFNRLAQLSGLNFGAYILFGPGSPFDLQQEEYITKLSDLSSANRPFRQRVFELFRAPLPPDAGVEDSDRADPGKLLPLYGDAFGERETGTHVELALTSVQHDWLKNWAEGNCTVKQEPAPKVTNFEKIPLADQPHALNRSHMESILGGPFHPGIELTWTLRLPSMWKAPFRLNVLPEGRMPNLDFGETLTPETALSPMGPFYSNGPGILTAFLGIPWQTDHASCDAGYRTGIHLPLPSYWAPRAPNQVLSEAAYESVHNQALTTLQRIKHLSYRSQWYRLLSPNYLSRIRDMVRHWDQLGIIVEKAAPKDHEKLGIPPYVLVETELESAGNSPRGSSDDETLILLNNIQQLENISVKKALEEIPAPKTPPSIKRMLRRDEK